MTDESITPPAPATGVVTISPSPALTIERGGVGAARADRIDVSVGGIGAARADRISVEMGGIGAAAAREIRVDAGQVGAVAAQDVRLKRAIVQSVLAQRVTLERGSFAGIVIAARVDGDGRPLIDRGAGLAAAAVLVGVWLIIRRLR